jgi:hypothetical protein
MLEVISWIVAGLAFGALFWALLRLLRYSQADDRSCSDKDSGWYNDAG